MKPSATFWFTNARARRYRSGWLRARWATTNGLGAITRYGDGLSIEQALRRQRGSHAQALLLMLPSLGGWSRDPQLSGHARSFTAALERG